MATARCNGEITTDVDGVPYCLDEMSAPLAWETVPEFSLEQIDGETAAGYFAAGFVVIGTCWVIGFAARAILGVVKR